MSTPTNTVKLALNRAKERLLSYHEGQHGQTIAMIDAALAEQLEAKGQGISDEEIERIAGIFYDTSNGFPENIDANEVAFAKGGFKAALRYAHFNQAPENRQGDTVRTMDLLFEINAVLNRFRKPGTAEYFPPAASQQEQLAAVHDKLAEHLMTTPARSENRQGFKAGKEIREAGNELNDLVKHAQAILAEHLPPDGISEKDAIDLLLGLLDGPDQRKAQAAWDRALSLLAHNPADEDEITPANDRGCT